MICIKYSEYLLWQEPEYKTCLSSRFSGFFRNLGFSKIDFLSINSRTCFSISLALLNTRFCSFTWSLNRVQIRNIYSVTHDSLDPWSGNKLEIYTEWPILHLIPDQGTDYKYIRSDPFFIWSLIKVQIKNINRGTHIILDIF